MVELLILNGADINAKDKANWTPIFMAASEGFFFTRKCCFAQKSSNFPKFICLFFLTKDARKSLKFSLKTVPMSIFKANKDLMHFILPHTKVLSVYT